MTHRRTLMLLGLAAAAATAPAIAQEPLRMMEAQPSARSVMNQQNQQFFVRFDGPVDHHASRLTVLRDGAVVRELQPRLGAQPNTLYAAAGSLPPGEYRLEWSAMPLRGGAAAQGGIAFTVR